MSRSPEEQKADYEKAEKLYRAGRLKEARPIFERIVREGGEYAIPARQFLKEIAERLPELTRGGGRDPRDNPIESPPMGAASDLPPMPMADPDPPRPPFGVARPPKPLPLPVSVHGNEVEEAVVAAASQPLRRTPHMDLTPEPPVQPGEVVKVSVYADAQALRPGESGEDLVLEAPPDRDRFEVDVWLSVGEPYAVQGSPIGRLILLRDKEKSEPVEFTVLRKAGPEPEKPVLFSALFSYQGRSCGRVTRQFPAKDVGEPLPEPGIRIDADAQRPDLSVRIVRSAGDERLFDCAVETPWLPKYEHGVTGLWRLPSLASDFVKATMDLFTKGSASPFARTAALRGAGIGFFEASPKIFQQVYWELIDQGHPPRTISIVTEEPAIPWELMVPTRDGGDERDPLGVSCLISRWTAKNHILPPQKLPLKDAFVVAPKDSKLKSAQPEAEMIAQAFPVQRIDPANVLALNTALGQQARSFLHFICHGKSGQAGRQILLLDKLEELDATLLRGMAGVTQAFKSARPFVFLNACEVGRQEPALVGAGGFAEAFMALGASGVIAPLWSVKDDLAHEIAEIFYKRIQEEPETPFAQILSDLRKRSYAADGGEDTYAAYCFYGDPLARRAPASP